MPIRNARFYQTLGLAARAGLISSGEFSTMQALKAGKAAFVLVDEAASANTKKEFEDGCSFRSVPCWETEGNRLAQAIGKPGRMCLAVHTGTLADKLKTLAGAQE
ncbi:MAG: ribosomal L7Ae/L30e/S12e/Gadd45 family protein [Clostridia bacterium]|nr:ribosomal L7Ae/L30e/S12e/Gadd45 family protein [Clostridia bacterium]